MRTREEANALLERLMNDLEPIEAEGMPPFIKKGQCWHFGRQEVHYLLDFIYGTQPK